MRNLILLFVLGLLVQLPELINAQGCVAIRNMSCSGNAIHMGNNSGQLGVGDMVASLGYRYFRSFRHFRGNHEETHRIEEGTEVINLFHGFDLGFSYGFNRRLSATLILPFTINDRSSLYEHTRDERFHTRSAGLGDIRLSASMWLCDPAKHHKGNVALGLGVKLPTGNPGVEDQFYKRDDDGNLYTITQPVDQSIQLGDGGFGISADIQGFQNITGPLTLFYSGSYLSNPREVNDVLRRVNSDPDDIFDYFSAADQFSARVGFFYGITPELAISAGGRIEGIPATDLIGGSRGYRRPGYAISVEPGISYTKGNFAFNLNVPIAVERNRIKSTSDKLNGNHGDAAFADYVINATVSYFIPRNQPSMPDMQK